MAQPSEGVLVHSGLGTELDALAWRRSSRSIGNGQCVETARLPGGGVAVRDSKDKAGPALRFPSNSWSAFVDGVKGTDFRF
jgi:uncharacterized protein DUF397